MANDFLPFAGSGGANVMTQAAYAAMSTRTTGFVSGTALSPQLNKVWRQSSIIASVLAQYISDLSGQDAVDDGTTATLLTNLKTSLRGRLVGVQTFDAVGTFTYTKTPGADTAIFDVTSGGGQGGGSPAGNATQLGFGTGGHSGCRLVGKISLVGVPSLSVTVGAGGNTGVAGAAGQAGSTSSVSTLITCPGGAGGGLVGPTAGPSIIANSAAYAQPSATGAVTVLVSQPGNGGIAGQAISGGIGISGVGGCSPTFGVNISANIGTGTGSPGTQKGQGGSGAFSAINAAVQKGGDGAPGKITVYEYAGIL